MWGAVTRGALAKQNALYVCSADEFESSHERLIGSRLSSKRLGGVSQIVSKIRIKCDGNKRKLTWRSMRQRSYTLRKRVAGSTPLLYSSLDSCWTRSSASWRLPWARAAVESSVEVSKSSSRTRIRSSFARRPS